VVGSSTIGECLEKGLLHRAVAVLVIRSGGRFLLQRRSGRDRWHPGLWTISSTGHVKEGEAYEAAAGRELREELGISSDLDRVGKFLLPPLRSQGLTEWEWVAFFIARTDSPFSIDPVELDAAEEFDRTELLALIEGDTITPDAVILLKDYLGAGKLG
jgi:isopentenyldiphosphate isomerase